MARVLVGCEFSGVVRNAFRAAGHDAWSCDLLPAADASEYHIQADVRLAVRARQWDLFIAHPPCTLLCNSGVRWLYGGKGTTVDQGRWRELETAASFFVELLVQRFKGIRHVAIENPIMHKHARGLIFGPGNDNGRPSQILQPWQFGHGEIKATCLWLSRDLPRLKPTCIVDGREPRVHHESPGADRWKRRSVTYQGIAAAMAEQWGPLL